MEREIIRLFFFCRIKIFYEIKEKGYYGSNQCKRAY